jgi:hypothetical protein
LKKLSFIGDNCKIISKKAIIKNLNEITSFLGSDVISFIKNNYEDNFIELIRFCLKNSLSLTSLKKMSMSEVNPEKLKLFDGSNFRHDTEDSNFMRGKFFRGKTRPEHSMILKGKSNLKNKKDNWSEKRKQYNEKMNSHSWKQKVLHNKGIYVSKTDVKEIENTYSNMLRERVISIAYKESKIKNFLGKNQYKEYYDLEEFENVLKNDVESAFNWMNSIIGSFHTLSSENSMGNPKFKKEFFNIKELEKCLNKESFYTRSTAETEFIKKFIIPNLDNLNSWGYEIETFNLNNKLYTPDFIIDINNIKYIVEIKGYIRDEKNFDRIVKCNKEILIHGKYIFIENINVTFDTFLKMISMEFYKKTHITEKIKSKSILSLGFTREQIINNLEVEDIFIYNGLFFYTVDSNWNIVNFYLLINNKCVSELSYDLNKEEIILENNSSNRFSKKLKEHFKIHLDELKELKNKKNKEYYA